MNRDRRQCGNLKRLARRIRTTPAHLPPADLIDRTMASVRAADRTARPNASDRQPSFSQCRELAIYCYGVAAVHLAFAIIFGYVWLNCHVLSRFHLPPWLAFQPAGWLLAAAPPAAVGWIVSRKHHGFPGVIRWLIAGYMGFFLANGLWTYYNATTAVALQGALTYMAAGLSVGFILRSRVLAGRDAK